MENWEYKGPSQSHWLTSNQSCRPSCSVGLLSVVAKYCMPSSRQVQDVFCFNVSPYQAGWCWHCSSWALAADTMTQPSVSAPRRTIYTTERSRITAQGPPGKVRRLVKGWYQWLQLGLILAYWVNAMVLEWKWLSWIPAGRNHFSELSAHSYLVVGEVNTYYLAQCWGALVKKSYLAVNQLNKTVSVIYVIRLAGSNATQLVTHTWLLFCEHYKPICLFNQLLQHVGTCQRNRKWEEVIISKG